MASYLRLAASSVCAGLGVKARVSALEEGAGRVLDEKGRCAVSRSSCCATFWPEPKQSLRLTADRPDTAQRERVRREIRRRPRTDEDGRATTRPRRTLLEAGGSSDVPLRAVKRRLQAVCRGEERLSGKRAEVVRATAVRPPPPPRSLPRLLVDARLGRAQHAAAQLAARLARVLAHRPRRPLAVHAPPHRAVSSALPPPSHPRWALADPHLHPTGHWTSSRPTSTRPSSATRSPSPVSL